ncbi:MAG: hypothetical protein QOH68_4008 [Nocardioidaceae bacterium]|jgi:acid phosphatase|nr:hypothetical protein [Nocardioidaceae bacterium]
MLRKSSILLGALLACSFLTGAFLLPTSNDTSPAASAAPRTDGAVTKLLVFVEENHSLAQMKAGMPYAYSLAKQYGHATKYTATMHPSLPNYIAMAGGKTYGITTNAAPASNKVVDGASVFGQAIAAGKTAKVYADGMPSNCATSGGTGYAVRHNPWPYFAKERALCNQFDVPVTKLAGDISAGTLPNAGMVIPNVDHDAHDGSLAAADQWFKGYMTKIFAGPDWKSGHLAVILTADEDDKNSGNVVLTTVIHPSQKAKVVNTLLTHHSMTRLYNDVVGAPYLHAAATAPSMSAAFGLPIPPQKPEPECTTTVPPVLPVSKELVTGFAVTAQGPNAIVMKWNAVPNAVKYRIQLSTSPKMTNAEYRRFDGPTAILDGLKAKTTYYLKVRTIDVDGGNISPYTTTPVMSATR